MLPTDENEAWQLGGKAPCSGSVMLEAPRESVGSA